MKKPVRKSLAKVKKETWVIFSRFIRLRDCLKTTGSIEYGECFTCGGTFEFRELQAGHYLSGRKDSILFSEKGVNAQCGTCNIWGRIKTHGDGKGMPIHYRKALLKMYGEGIEEELMAEFHQSKKYGIKELLELQETHRQQIKELEK